MRLQLVFSFCLFPLFVVSCSGDGGVKYLRYKGYLPNFSVNIPADSINSNVLFLKSSVRMIQSLALNENPTNIVCTTAIENWNAAPQLPSSRPAGNNGDNPFCGTDIFFVS